METQASRGMQVVTGPDDQSVPEVTRQGMKLMKPLTPLEAWAWARLSSSR